MSRMTGRRIGVAIAAALSTALAAIAPPPVAAGGSEAAGHDSPRSAAVGDPQRGAAVYQLCSACHSLDEDDVGPRHRGVVGRRAGAIAEYSYSSALKSSGLVWSPETLDRWLEDPQKLVPGSRMFFALKNAQDRADVIAWLAQQR